jgi:hypothetical protein
MKGRPQVAVRPPNGWLSGPMDGPRQAEQFSGAPEQGVRVASGSTALFGFPTRDSPCGRERQIKQFDSWAGGH